MNQSNDDSISNATVEKTADDASDLPTESKQDKTWKTPVIGTMTTKTRNGGSTFADGIGVS